MQTTILQPPYPHAGTVAAAVDCQAWMVEQLQALEPGDSDLIVLPEYANVPGLGECDEVRSFAAGDGAGFIRKVTARAIELHAAVTFSLAVEDGDHWYNRAVLHDADGALAAAYDKIHITDADPMGMSPGTSVVAAKWGSCTVAFAVCFDLYFAEYFAALSALGVDLIICPSYQRSESAERICLQCRARALDTGAWLVRGSYAMHREDSGGRSLAAAPDGSLPAVAGGEPEVLHVSFDPRQKFVKPASHGSAPVEHRELIESHRQDAVYRSVRSLR